MHTYIGGSWWLFSEHFIWRHRISMLKSYWQHPWKHGRYLCQTLWKDGGYKDGVWKVGGWLCGVLGLPLMFYVGRYRRLLAGSFHCGDLSGGFFGTGEEKWYWRVDFGVVLAAFGCWDLGFFSLWRWGTLDYCYSQTCISCLSPLSGLPLSMQWWY